MKMDDTVDEGIGSNESSASNSELQLNLKEVLSNLKALNGPIALGDGHSMDSLSNLTGTRTALDADSNGLTDSLEESTVPNSVITDQREMGKTLEEPSLKGDGDGPSSVAELCNGAEHKAEVDKDESVEEVILLEEAAEDRLNNTPSKLAEHCSASSSPFKTTGENGSKSPHPLLIGDKVRNSLKGLVAKMQTAANEVKNSSGEDSVSKDSSGSQDKDPSQISTGNHKDSTCSRNLFENLSSFGNKVLGSSSGDVSSKDSCKKPAVSNEEGSMEVIELDDSIEDPVEELSESQAKDCIQNNDQPSQQTAEGDDVLVSAPSSQNICDKPEVQSKTESEQETRSSVDRADVDQSEKEDNKPEHMNSSTKTLDSEKSITIEDDDGLEITSSTTSKVDSAECIYIGNSRLMKPWTGTSAGEALKTHTVDTNECSSDKSIDLNGSKTDSLGIDKTCSTIVPSTAKLKEDGVNIVIDDSDDNDDSTLQEEAKTDDKTEAVCNNKDSEKDNTNLEEEDKMDCETEVKDKVLDTGDVDMEVDSEHDDKPEDKLAEAKSELTQDNDSVQSASNEIKSESKHEIKSEGMFIDKEKCSESDKQNSSLKEEEIKKQGSVEDSKVDLKLDDRVKIAKLEVPTSNERKRPAEASDEGVEGEKKRSRLDEVIGKLGSVIGIAPESVESAVASELSEEEEEEDTTESTESETKSSEDTTASEEEGDETEETEKDSSPVRVKPKGKKKYIKLTEKELEEIVRSKVSAYLKAQREAMEAKLKAQREALVAPLHEKIKELTVGNDIWKQQVKDLQVKVSEVTILQQKHEKRKAATVALRQITTRSIAVQVDEQKTQNMRDKLAAKAAQGAPGQKTPPKAPEPVLAPYSTARTVTPTKQVAKAPPSTPPSTTIQPSFISSGVASNGTIRLPVPQASLANTVMVQQSQAAAAAQSVSGMFSRLIPAVTASTASTQRTTVKSLLDSTRNTITAPQTTVTQLPAPVVSSAVMMIGSPPPGFTLSTGIPGGPSGLIVVTTIQQPATSTGKSLLSKSSTSTVQTVSTSSLPQFVQAVSSTPAVKVIDLTDEEESSSNKNTLAFAQAGAQIRQIGVVPQQRALRPVNPPQQGVANQQGIILSSPIGSQIVKTTLPQQVPQTAYQLVFNSSSPAIRAGNGNLVTVVPSPGLTSPGGAPVWRPQPAAGTMGTTLVTTSQFQGVIPGQQIRVSKPPPPYTATHITPTASSRPVLLNSVTQAAVPAQNIRQQISVPVVSPQHPAPFPAIPTNQQVVGFKALPPKPSLKISRVSQGIVLSWNMNINSEVHADIASYQLFAYQEGATSPSTSLWKKVGDVKALPLPMACTLTQFQEGNKYHFAVRASDVHGRVGVYSDPSSIHLTLSGK